MCETYPTLSAEVPGLALRVDRAPQLARVRLRRTVVGVARGVARRVGAREEQAGLRIKLGHALSRARIGLADPLAEIVVAVGGLPRHRGRIAERSRRRESQQMTRANK